MRWMACATVLVCGLILAGCGSGTKAGSASSGSASAPSSAAQATAAAPTSAAPSSTATATKAAAGNPVVPADFCTFLGVEAPRIKADGSTAGAEADFAIDLANWIDAHPPEKPRTAADLDDASQGTCADLRSQVVASIGSSSFAGALGG